MNKSDNRISPAARMNCTGELYTASREDENYHNAFYGLWDMSSEFCQNTTAWD